MTLIFSFSRGAAAWRRWSAGLPAVSAGLSADFTSDLGSTDLASADLVSALASAFASVFASAFSWAFSTTADRSAAFFSMMAFSEIPLALTPAAGRLLTLAVVSAGLASDLASALPSPLGLAVDAAVALAVDAAAAGASALGLVTM
jgi:hypothetical protein